MKKNLQLIPRLLLLALVVSTSTRPVLVSLDQGSRSLYPQTLLGEATALLTSQDFSAPLHAELHPHRSLLRSVAKLPAPFFILQPSFEKQVLSPRPMGRDGLAFQTPSVRPHLSDVLRI